MRNTIVLIIFVCVTANASAEKRYRVSFENVLTGPAVGTDNLHAVQIEVDVGTVGPVVLGFSARKEGRGSSDGWGFGVHASRDWRADRHIGLVTQAGVRFFAPSVEYSRYRFAQRDNVLVWQEWDRISSNFQLGGATGTAGAWAPNVGVFAEYDIGPVSIRGGIRATVHRYGVQVVHRPSDGDLQVVRDDRFFRVIFAPTIAIGF